MCVGATGRCADAVKNHARTSREFFELNGITLLLLNAVLLVCTTTTTTTTSYTSTATTATTTITTPVLHFLLRCVVQSGTHHVDF